MRDLIERLEEARGSVCETATERGIDPDKPVVVQGVKGVSSKSFSRRFKSLKAAYAWMDKNAGDIAVYRVMNDY